MSDLFYLHEYRSGDSQTEHSCGFVRVSVRGGWLEKEEVSAAVNLKYLYSHKDANDSIYVLIKAMPESDGSAMGAVKVGELRLNNGFGRTELVIPRNNISGSGFNWEDTAGILFAADGIDAVAAALWDENSMLSGMIRYGAVKLKPADTEETGRSEAEDIAVKAAEENEITVIPAEAEEVKETEAEIKDVEAEEMGLRLAKTERKPAEDAFYEDNGTGAGDNPGLASPGRITLTQMFDIINGNLIDAFDDDKFYDCMEVTPAQLAQLLMAREQNMPFAGSVGTGGRDLAKVYQKISDNSFLMHGYYTFGHILAAKTSDNPDGLFVGVPGVYSNKERFMASMFNFNNFKRSHRSDCRNPHFGYWYQEM